MTRLEYLQRHHEITASAIGLARLHLGQCHAAEAKVILDTYCNDLEIIHKQRLAAIAAECDGQENRSDDTRPGGASY